MSEARSMSVVMPLCGGAEPRLPPKQLAYTQMAGVRSLLDTLPWYGEELEETRALMGHNLYSYGMGPNRKTLENFFRYSHQQGFTDRELKIEDLFEPSSLSFEEAS